MTSESYTPVSCAQHSKYELAIMQQQTLTITWQDEYDVTRQLKLEPYDVVTEHKAEYLLAKDSHGEDKKIRLDKIIEAYPD